MRFRPQIQQQQRQQQQQQGDSFVLSKTPANYFIYFVISDWFENSPLIDPPKNAFMNFGKRLGNKAIAIAPINGAYEKTRAEMLSLDWPGSFLEILEDEICPFIVITNTNLKEQPFSPKSDPNLVFFCRDALLDTPEFILFLSKLEKLIKNNENICSWDIDFYESKRKKSTFFKALYDGLIMQPNIAGIGIDLKPVINSLSSKR